MGRRKTGPSPPHDAGFNFPKRLLSESFGKAAVGLGHPNSRTVESNAARSTFRLEMLTAILGALKWGAVGFVVTLFLMVMFEASRIHDDIPVPEFKRRHTKRTAVILSTFAGILSGLVWLLVQHWD